MKIGAAIDPHLWISPSGAILEAENIAKALEAADPAGAAVYKKNLAAFASGIKAASDAFRKAGLSDVTLKLYPGLRHEILNEAAMRDTVYGDIGAWLDRVLG